LYDNNGKRTLHQWLSLGVLGWLLVQLPITKRIVTKRIVTKLISTCKTLGGSRPG
jgi:hypothetical protein